MMARLRLLAAMAGLCCASIGCSCSHYAGMKYDGGCGCGPGRWAPPCAAGRISRGCVEACGGGCDGPCDVTCGDRCACDGDGVCAGGALNSLCGCSGCCGRLYWSEWHDSPPRCEPCDCYGNFTSGSCCHGGLCASSGCPGGGSCATALECGLPSDRRRQESVVGVALYEKTSDQGAAFDAYQAEFDEGNDVPLK